MWDNKHPFRLSAMGSELCCSAADLLAMKPLSVSLMRDFPEVEIAFLGIRGGGGGEKLSQESYCEEKLSRETPGNQMAPSMLHCAHTFIKDYFGCLSVIDLGVWGHKELENCSQLQLNKSYF